MDADERIRHLEQRVERLEQLLREAQEIALKYRDHPLVKKMMKYAGIDSSAYC